MIHIQCIIIHHIRLLWIAVPAADCRHCITVKMKTFATYVYDFIIILFFYFYFLSSRKQSPIRITQTNYTLMYFKLINSPRSALLFAAVSMVHVYVLKLMVTQITVLLITSVDLSAFCCAIMLIALAVMFVAMQSQIFLFGVIFQCQAMAVAMFGFRVQYLRLR